MELDAGFRLVRFAEADELSAENVVEVWTREALLPEEEARRRVSELAYVALAPDGGLAGVSTAALVDNLELRTPMWAFRTFVSREYRRTAVALSLLRHTRDWLERRYVDGDDTRAPGVQLDLENEGVKRTQNEAHWWWPGVGFTFIGETALGAHRRVYFFAGARAPLPAPA